MSGDDSQPSLQLRTQAFLQDFLAKGQKLVRELIEENEQLRATLAAGTRGAESDARIARLTQQIKQLEAECSTFRRQVGAREHPSADYRDRLDALEQEHYQLAAMYVAGRQLQSSTTVEEVVRTVTEILLNFVGVGHFTFFAVDESRNVLFPLHRCGAETGEVAEIPLAHLDVVSGPSALASPGAVNAPRMQGPALLDLSLRSGSRPIGLLRLEAFLPQKSEFADSDLALLEIVAETAGMCLESAWIRAHAEALPFTRGGLEELVVA